MPLTPTHWFFPILLCELLFKSKNIRIRAQIFTVLLVSLPDIEGFGYFFLKLPIRLHGPLHLVIGTLLLGIIGTLVFSF